MDACLMLMMMMIVKIVGTISVPFHCVSYVAAGSAAALVAIGTIFCSTVDRTHPPNYY